MMLLSSSEASQAQLDIHEAWHEASEAPKAIEAEHKAFKAKFEASEAYASNLTELWFGVQKTLQKRALK